MRKGWRGWGATLRLERRQLREKTIIFSKYLKGRQKDSFFGHTLQPLNALRLYGTTSVNSHSQLNFHRSFHPNCSFACQPFLLTEGRYFFTTESQHLMLGSQQVFRESVQWMKCSNRSQTTPFRDVEKGRHEVGRSGEYSFQCESPRL